MLRYLAFLLPVLFLSPLTGCATYGAISQAETLSQKTFALYGEFVIAKEAAADVVENPDTPDVIAQAIVTANRVATPLVRTAVDLARRYVATRVEYETVRASSQTRADALMASMATLTSQLTEAYSKAEPEARRLIAAVNSIKK